MPVKPGFLKSQHKNKNHKIAPFLQKTLAKKKKNKFKIKFKKKKKKKTRKQNLLQH